MKDMRIEKPTLFISHAVTDKPIAAILKSEIDKIFANGVNVFASSVPGIIEPGADWLDSIKDNLARAKAIIVIITPVSINRPWIWFEVGASWSKMSEGHGKIYPLCVPEIELSELPEPLSRLQALSLGKADHIKLFFQTLCDQFGFGNMKGFKTSSIKSLLPKYSQLKVDSKDLDAGTIYTGPYSRYSDDELKEVLDEDYLYEEAKNVRKYFSSFTDRDSSIFRGKLIHYNKLDERLKLPLGTSKKYLKEVALRYNLFPEKEWENSIRFKEKVIF